MMQISVADMKRLLRALDLAAAEYERAAEDAPSLRESTELIRLLADLNELRRRIEIELRLAEIDPNGTVN